VGYLAPEQVHGQAVDQRADVFSFGCVLYEVAAGQPPFKRQSSMATLHAVAYEEPSPIASLNAAVPPELTRIVGRCLAKDRQQRYQTMSNVATDLRALFRRSSPLRAEPPPTTQNRLAAVRR